MRKILLFIHGRRDDDATAVWRSALDRGMRGKETFADRGYQVIAPSYLKMLDGPDLLTKVEPAYRYGRSSDLEYRETQRVYVGFAAELQRLVPPAVGPGWLAKVPNVFAQAAADALIAACMADVELYRSNEIVRKQILTHIAGHLPSEPSQLIVVGHSLGSVVALDLIYHLPSSCTVRALITIGSPLSMAAAREHLHRAREHFPSEVVKSWLNVVGVDDPITGGRGVAGSFPQATDRFIESHGHSSVGYLEDATVANWIQGVDDSFDTPAGHALGDSSKLPAVRLSPALLTVLAEFQYALRVEQAERDPHRRRRMGDVRNNVVAMAQDDLAVNNDGPGELAVLRRLGKDNADVLRGQLAPGEMAALLIRANLHKHPFAPYDIKITNETRTAAVKQLLQDLGCSETWMATVREATNSALAVHDEGLFEGWEWADLWKGMAVVVGIGAVAAVPFLAAAFAPAGLAGGAAIVAGLAELGPGGLLGGMGVLGVVGAVGGAVAVQAADSMLAGTAAEVQRNVTFLQSSALVRKRLDLYEPQASRFPEYLLMAQMESQAGAEASRHRLYNEKGSNGTKAAEQKLAAIKRALDWMDRNDLGPRALTG